MSSTLKPRPLDLSHDVHLSGVFAPVDDEVSLDDLEVVGAIPRDLTGAYLRNGPNPKFPPLGSYTYPLDGDGMVHGIWLEDGKARYRNRYVMTKGLQAEVRAGRALWGGVMTPIAPDAELAGDLDPSPDGGKLLLDINVIRHAGRYLALGEGVQPYELTPELASVGACDFGGRLPEGVCAHPKVDPVSGEMIVFRYGFFGPPWLEWATVAPDGTVTRGPEPIPGVDEGYMIHDFVVTEDYLVIFVNPAAFDLAAAMAGGNPLAWRPELGTRIAVVPRAAAGGDVRWIETDSVWVWHWANAYQDGGQIVTHYPSYSHLSLGLPGTPRPECHLVQARLDLDTRTATTEVIDDRGTEFPRVDDRRMTRRHRFMTVSSKSGQVDGLIPGEFDEVLRFDLDRGTVQSHRLGNAVTGEAAFAPRDGGDDEGSGYMMAFVDDLATGTSSFQVIDVDDFEGPPVATVKLPVRVPMGLHGSWFPAQG